MRAIIGDTGGESIIWGLGLGASSLLGFICVFQYCGYEGIYWKQCGFRIRSVRIWRSLTEADEMAEFMFLGLG